ncbi:hypothetical protein CTAYLR_004573 [Chrysophaeum taylorii]|uniref:PA domain-containing protein n=1 Tax=Chrysophaeum taylorii TaxID=2483200 RepID=A0AAD7UDI1_9STRA|nr:hypothetical protein CTAYLR_004573 [Chrysophaeum taylorii]
MWWWLLLVRGAVASDGTSIFQIEVPYSLYTEDGYRHKEAMFGSPKYGVTLTEKMYYANSTMCDDSALPMGRWTTPYLLMVDRGDCTFVKKVRNAQNLGASGVIVADNKCVCSDEACSSTPNMACESDEPIMADDGSGSDITIPAILLWKTDADKIKDYFFSEPNPVVQAKLAWSIPQPDNRVEWELWTKSDDDTSIDFLIEFRSTVFALGLDQQFTPHFYTWNGTAYGCPESGRCGTLCTNSGRYCAPDPDGQANVGLSGADVVTENLRRTCLWKLEGGKDQTDPNEVGVGRAWWHYLGNFTHFCDTAETFKSEACVRQAMDAAGASFNAVQACMDESGGVARDGGKNSILEHELGELKRKNIYVVPECIINNQAIWGALSTQNVLETICHGYSTGDEPDACGCQSLAANTRDPSYLNCLADATTTPGSTPQVYTEKSSKKTTTSSSMPWWGVFLLVMSIILVMLLAGLAYWKKTQQQMRDQVRGILAEYMPLEDLGPSSTNAGPATHSVLHTPGLSIQA